MNGIHDMGGMHGFGPVAPEPNEPPFHSRWEGRALAMNRIMSYAKIWNIDKSRAVVEGLPPRDYLGMSYYAKWALRLETLLVEFGLVGADEVAAGHSLRPGKPLARRLPAADVPKALARGSFSRPTNTVAQFKPGDRVRTRIINPTTHTRLPRYARGRTGVIECVRGFHVFPDSVATGAGENPQWLYTVLFESRELWGESADPTLKVSIEAWEPYLEPA
ncbi:MAG: nitrile hydratase subunit beta [Alphaproteobacteria bacterium]|jgi:nitrile hydratase|nr:nitrile hydratase subunit beta [Alphaproteobacteria bacterium]MEA2989794.1 nitrile hydratase subunit beta [Alphaproteobacteria bacterium]